MVHIRQLHHEPSGNEHHGNENPSRRVRDNGGCDHRVSPAETSQQVHEKGDQKRGSTRDPTEQCKKFVITKNNITIACVTI